MHRENLGHEMQFADRSFTGQKNVALKTIFYSTVFEDYRRNGIIDKQITLQLHQNRIKHSC